MKNKKQLRRSAVKEFARIEKLRSSPDLERNDEHVHQQRLFGAAMTLGWLMKKKGYGRILPLLLFLIFVDSAVAQVQVYWTPSPSAAAVATKIYASTNALTFATLASAPVKVTVQVPLTNVLVGITNTSSVTNVWFFAATAVDAVGNESTNMSNVYVYAQPPAQPPANPAPLPPSNLRGTP